MIVASLPLDIWDTIHFQKISSRKNSVLVSFTWSQGLLLFFRHIGLYPHFRNKFNILMFMIMINN
ncbi:hypothetical protein Avbf_04919 [Armadillidium vulgare]|nr:hypothetical protein Avbf_04919 [Armadillidium vulgare]